jgi:hypothetical protein
MAIPAWSHGISPLSERGFNGQPAVKLRQGSAIATARAIKMEPARTITVGVQSPFGGGVAWRRDIRSPNLCRLLTNPAPMSQVVNLRSCGPTGGGLSTSCGTERFAVPTGAQMSSSGSRNRRHPRPTVPDLPGFLELVVATRASIEKSTAPLNYRRQVLSELRIIEQICGLPRPEMKTVVALVRRLIMVINEFDPSIADSLGAWVAKNHSG